MNTQKISEGINDIIDVAIAIKAAAADKRISFREGLKIGSEVLDLRNEILEFDAIKKEWNSLSNDLKIDVALEVNQRIHSKGFYTQDIQSLIDKSIAIIAAFVDLIEEVKNLEKVA